MSARSGLFVFLVLSIFGFGVPVAGEPLGSAALQIAGTDLVASPDAQTVPFDTPTIVETHLVGYDPTRGVLPSDLRVVGELSGPEISGSLRLETTPNEPFSIPRFRIQGEYRLDNIRLVQGDQVLGFATPRDVVINVTKVLITKVSSRAMTQDEIRNYGLVIDEDNYQAFNLTFGFAVKPDKIVEYSVPIVYELFGPRDGVDRAVERVIVPENRGRTLGHRFRPPGMVPFKIDLNPKEREVVEVPKGGCDLKAGECRKKNPPPPPMVGVVMFPSEMSLLHQFFAVTLVVQNGAPAGDPLQIRDLTAKMTIESNGLRPAETDPPTPLGVPVPLRVAGPDGRLDTGDDLIIAQATAEAEFLVEGVKEGTHVVSFDMLGTLEGLPAGPQPIAGKARGAVVVRDPTLSATLSHPDVVGDGEEYSLLVTMANLGNAPVNDLTMKLPAAQLSNASLAPGQSSTVSFGSLLPGEAETAEYRLIAELSGRVIASSVRSPSAINPTFEFRVGVADDIPLSPESLALPSTSKLLPIALRKEAAGLLGLGHSLATAPAALVVGRPQVSRGTVDDRVYRLAQAGRQVGLGDALFDSAAVLAAEWSGTRDQDWAWDALRRSTGRGVGMAVEMAEVFSDEPVDGALERAALSTAFLGDQHWVAIGGDTRFALESRTSGKAMGDDHVLRELPFAEHYPLDDGALVHVATPEDGGYRLVLWRDTVGTVDLRVALPPTVGGGNIPVTWWSGVAMAPGDRAEVLFDPVTTALDLVIDDGGDGTIDRTVAGIQDHLVQQPFRVLAVQQNMEVDPSGHVIDVLFSEDVDLRSLIPSDPDDFQLPGNTSNGGTTPTERSLGGGLLGQPEIENLLEGFFNPRIVRVVFSNPLSPYASSTDRTLQVSGLTGATGRAIGSVSIDVPVPAVFQPGGVVEGQVIDARGQPLAGAVVTLHQFDRQGYGPFVECKRHKTALIVADAEGRFRFDYVRQTDCSDRFKITASSPIEPYTGDADGRIRSVGGSQELNIVMLGRGVLSGTVRYDDGTVPEGLSVFVESPIFDEGYRAWVGDEGEYRVAGVPVGTLTLWALDQHGNRAAQTLEMPTAGAEVERDLVIVRRPDPATARVSGRVVDLVSGEPEVRAYVALYVDGGQVDTRRTDSNGEFDFGVVPAGVAELEAFDATTGRKGAQLAFTLGPDADVFQELQLRDDRGSVEGTVRRIHVDGTIEPVAGAVVYLVGTPFNTTTDAQGFYRIDDALTGTWSIKAADVHPDRQLQTSARVTIGAGTVQTADLYFEDAVHRVGRLEGQVFDEAGNPVEGAVVHLAGGYWSTNWHHEVFTDDDGRFTILGLDPGTYGVHAIKGSSGAIAWATVRFEGDTASVAVRFARATITGRTFVTVDGQQQGIASQLRFRRTEVIEEWGLVGVGRDFETMVTEGDGTFTIDALPGFYEIHATNAFHDTDYRSVRGVVDELGVFRNIEFLRNGLIRGVVRGLDGEPVAGVDLVLRGGLFTDYETQSDEHGEFLFDLLPPANYQITAEYSDGGIHRTARIWAQMRRYGDEMDVEVDLPRQGRVEAWVEDAGGTPVADAVVVLKERGFPFRRIVRNTDESGSVSFENIFEGDITVRAVAPELGGLGGRSNVTLTDEGQDVYALIRLEGSGEIVGQVISPETGLPVPNARVRLLKGAYPTLFVDSTNTDGDGIFRFTQLKLGEYRVRVFDPTTGRRGLRTGYVLSSDGDVAERDIVLEVRGNVRGGLYDPDAGGEGVPGATIELRSFGLKWFKTYSTTGPDGLYTFEGIPEGDLEVRSKTRRRSTVGYGTIEDEDQWIDIDLYLQRQAALTGKVIGPPRQDGTGGEVVDGVNVILTDYPRDIVGATTENPFRFDDVLPNELHILTAREINGGHRVFRSTAVAPGDTRDVTLQMRAIGSTTIEVYDSQGAPVPGAIVHAHNQYSFEHHRPADAWSPEGKGFDGSTGADHVIQFDGVREGPVKVRAIDPITDLRGAGYGVLRWEDQDLQIRVDLQPSGTIRGQVFEADGVTPSVGAQIAVELNAFYWDWVYATTDEEGRFELTDLPISGGAYHLIAQDADGPGSWELWRDFTYDQEVHDHTLVLDEEDPRVVSVTPSSGTRDLPRSTDVTIQFSEPMYCGGCLGEAVYIAKLTGNKVGANYSWNADKTQLTIQPHGLLANHTGYKVVVEREVHHRRLTDPSRRPVAWRHLSSFYTADELPPKVIEIRPKHGADQVPVDSGITIRFNEPVDLDSLSGAFTVVDLLTGTPFTLTTLPSLDQRVVTLTPVGGFSPDQHVELSLTGVRDGAGNQMTQVVTSRFWTPDATPPTIVVDTPLVGQSFTSGDPIEVAAQVTDNRAVERVTFRLDDWSKTLTSPPWVWDVPAPIRAQVDAATVIVEAEDRYGNIATAEREISVTPLDNAVPPTVVTGCPVDLDFVAPGVELVVSAPVTDDLAVESAWLTVDGVEVARETPIDAADHAATLRWTPPVDATAGTSFALVLHSRDFAGNVTTRPLTVSVPNGTFVTTDQAMTNLPTDLVIADARVSFDSPLSGGSVLVLQGGRFEADADGADLDLDALRLQCGATARFETTRAATEIVVETGSTIRPRQLRTLMIDTSRLVVEADATIDAFGRGYYGWNDTPQAPSWVTKPDRGGGSHGGRGSFVTDYGRVYNSVYWPTLAGAGSSGGTFHTQSGSNGGGIVEIRADEMVLEGTIDIRGDYDLGISGAAGGSVAIDTGRLEGAGRILGRGGDTNCLELAGGGGRVAIWATELVGFDPAAQVDLRGGATDCGGSGVRPGAAGSLFVHGPASTYGDLVIDNQGRFEAPRTVLPRLGAGDITSVQVDGGDAWMVAATTFRPRWQGAWVRLENAAGDRLGTFRVLSADDDRLLLEGAASVVGASRYVGVYRFDDVTLIDARFEGNDPVEILGRLTIGDESEIDAPLGAVGHVEIDADTTLDLQQELVSGSMTIGQNASVTTPDGRIRIDVAGLLDIQSGAVLDVSGQGWEGGGGSSDSLRGSAPDGFDGSLDGGTHGGFGRPGSDAGQAFGSLYRPLEAGGGSGGHPVSVGGPFRGGSGGGVILLTAGTLRLDGTLRANGHQPPGDDQRGGAGGTVSIEANQLEGAGRIVANGADGRHSGGGGGRVALRADSIVDFDPRAQVEVKGGLRFTTDPYWGGAGTLFVRDASATYGTLIVDNEITSANPSVGRTPLIALADGQPTAVTADGADLRIATGTPLDSRWWGVWVVLEDAVGAEIGTFEVLEVDGDVLLLGNAASVIGQVVSYRGVYRFDTLHVVDGGGLRVDTGVDVLADNVLIESDAGIEGEMGSGHVEVADGETVDLRGPVRAQSMRIGAGATVRSTTGTVDLVIDGLLEIEAGALLDVTAEGYRGGDGNPESRGLAPDGITGSLEGGAHGGFGMWVPGSSSGEVYGSVYRPIERGAGGGASYYPPAAVHRGGDGGGRVTIVADEVLLDGTIVADGIAGYGGSYERGYERGGAGGTVSIEATRLAGVGTLRANGGDGDDSPGGGGRIALWVDDLTAFDVAARAEARGGRHTEGTGGGAAGTLFVRDAASTFGTLILDGRDAVTGRPRRTDLPILGEGSPTGVTVDGTDLRVATGTTLRSRWHGVWVVLEAADASELGTFEVTAIDGDVLVLRDAASVAASVAGYRGVYRFDTMRLAGGGTLRTDNGVDVWAASIVVDGGRGPLGELRADHFEVVSGNIEMYHAAIEAVSARIRSGATLSIETAAGAVDLDLSGDLVIEGGASIDVSGKGYAGGTNTNDYYGQTPPLVDKGFSGGAHGGLGRPTINNDDGEIFGSVYFPRYAGAGAGGSHEGLSAHAPGGPGGGVVRIRAATVQLDGDILANGTNQGGNPDKSWFGGGGGTVSIDASQIVGAGVIRANGGQGNRSAGGGGRIALHVDDLSLIDLDTQVEARGGAYLQAGKPRGGAGTVYLFDAASTYGRLLVRSPAPSDNPGPTPLPKIVDGTVGVAEIDADDPTALWIEPASGSFPLGVEGVWLRIDAVDYRILAEAGDRQRVLLDGAAGTVQVGDVYEGVYKFDQVAVRGEAWLKVENVYDVAEWIQDPGAQLDKPDIDAPTDILPVVVGEAVEGAMATLTATFTDVGSTTFSATVDWGDGSPVESVPVTTVTDGGSLEASHVWAGEGVYTVEVCITDEGGGVGCASIAVTVGNALPSFGWSHFGLWTAEDYNPSVPGDWRVSSTGLRVRQVATTKPHALLSPFPALGTRVSGFLESVGTDDDIMGFVVGMNPGDSSSVDADYLMVVWKKTDELPQRKGLHLYRIQGIPSSLWDLDGASGVTLVAEASTWSTVGYANTREYGFVSELTPSRYRLWMDGILQFDVAGDFSGLDGRFGIYDLGHATTFARRVRVTAASDDDPTLVPEVPMIMDRIDFSTFTKEEVIEGPNPTATWNVLGDGRKVEQRVESRPSFFVHDEPLAFRRVYGTMQSQSDPEIMGLTFGYEPGDNVDPDADYLLAVWRRNTSGNSLPGLRVYRVSGTPANFWAFDNQPAHFTKLADSVHWSNHFEFWIYSMDAHLEPDRFRLWVDDRLEIDVAGDFSSMRDGRFGLFVNAMSSAVFDDWRIEGVLADEGEPVEAFRVGFTDLDAAVSAEARHADGTTVAATLEQGDGLGTVLVASHAYLDDVIADGEVCVTDADGDTGCGVLPIRVRNVAPTVEAGADGAAAVGDPVVLSATFTDPGVGDTHTATVDWGDGSALASGTVDPVARTVTAGHTYDAAADFTVTVCVTDDDGDGACDAMTVAVVGSEPPSNLVVGMPASDEGQRVAMTASFTDGDVGDTHTATVDWGDGSAIEAIPVVATSSPLGGTLAAEHVYLDDGSYTVEVCITDAAPATTCGTTSATVLNTAPRIGLVDFNRWTVETFPPSGNPLGGPDWRVFADGSQVQQWNNTDPSVLYSDFPSHGTRLRGRVRPNHATDNDYVGFVVGFEPGDSARDDADYLLVTWKGLAEGGNPVGLRVYRVRGVPGNFWTLDLEAPTATLLATATTLGGSPWARTDYQFELEATDQRFRLWVEGNLEIDIAADPGDPFRNGRWGLYNHSNQETQYREWTVVPAGDLAAGTAWPPFRSPSTIDLGTWTSEALFAPGTATSAQWNVSTTGKRVDQVNNAGPTVLYDSDPSPFGRVSGMVQFRGDDDIGGFVLGFQPGQGRSVDADYLLVEWAGPQNNGRENGVRAYRIHGLNDSYRSVQPVLGVGRTDPWVEYKVYFWTVEYSPERLRLWIDGVLELDVAPDLAGGEAPFPEGRFGFFTFYQEGIRFVNFERHGQTVSEGDTTAPMRIAYGDLGLLDVHAATLDRGDGSAVDAVTGDVGTVGGGVVQLDPWVVQDDVVDGGEVCVSDDDGATACAPLPLYARNVAPTVDAGADGTSALGASFDLAASFTDPGSLDTHTASIDWGDGSTVASATVDPVARTLSASHVYTVAGDFTVDVCVTDDDGGTGCDNAVVSVAGTGPPSNVVVTVPAGDEGQRIALSASFTDNDVGDSHTATVDWGDGSAVEAVAVVATTAPLGGTSTAEHAYADDGIYTVTVCVTDATSNTACGTTTATVQNTAPRFGPIDFSTWTAETFDVTGVAPLWAASSDGTLVTQSANTSPSVLYGEVPARGLRYSGRLQPTGDDDFVGFVLGFEPGDTTRPEADYLLVSWKGAAQGDQPVGLRLYRVRGVAGFGPLGSQNMELLAIANRGDVPWTVGSHYEVSIEWTADRFRLWLWGNLEFDVAAPAAEPFTDGRFGLFAYSQEGLLASEWHRSPAGDRPADTVDGPFAERVFFDTWTPEDYTSGSRPLSDWTVSPSATMVTQTVNSRVAVFHSDFDVFGHEISGLWSFLADDDHGGMVFSFQPGELTEAVSDYVIVHWAGSGGIVPGLKAYRLRGIPAGNFSNFGNAPQAEWLADGQRFGSTAWTVGREYHFTARMERDRLLVTIDGEVEIDVTLDLDGGDEAFSDGRFGFYTQIQEQLRFRHLDRRGLRLDEGDTTSTMWFAYSDLGADDTHTATVDWGDGSPIETVAGDVGSIGERAIQLDPRVMLDDVSAGAEVCVIDDEGATACAPIRFHVRNVAPTVDAGAETSATVGMSFDLAATFVDPGSLDTHTATVDWGDGSAIEAATVDSVLGTVTASHVYAPVGDVTVTVCVTDDDGGSSCDTTTVSVLAAPAPTGGLGGTLWNDLDADGMIDLDEPPLVGVRIAVLDALDVEVASTTTTTTGAFTVAGLSPDLWTVRVDRATLPGGLDIATWDADGHGTLDEIATTVTASTTTNGLDFAYRAATTTVPAAAAATSCLLDPFDDLDADGLPDAAWSLGTVGTVSPDLGAVAVVAGHLELASNGDQLGTSDRAHRLMRVAPVGDFRFEVDVESLPVDPGGAAGRAVGPVVAFGSGETDPRVVAAFAPDGAGVGAPAIRFALRSAQAGTDIALADDVTGITLPVRLAIERRDGKVGALVSTDGGTSWTAATLAGTVGQGILDGLSVSDPAPPLDLGLIAASYDAMAPLTGAFDDVAICEPATVTAPVPSSDSCDPLLPVDVVIVLDHSGSSTLAFPGSLDRAAAARAAIDQLLAQLVARADGSRVAVVVDGLATGEATADGVRVLAGFEDPATISASLDTLAANPADATDGSIAALALHRAADLLATSGDAGHRSVIVWVGDGPPTASLDGGRYAAETVEAELVGIDVDLDDGGGGYAAWPVTAWRGPIAATGTSYVGRTSADVMVELDAARAALPGLEVHALGIDGDGTTTPSLGLDLLDYAAWLTAGSSHRAADTAGLLTAADALWLDMICQGAP